MFKFSALLKFSERFCPLLHFTNQPADVSVSQISPRKSTRRWPWRMQWVVRQKF